MLDDETNAPLLTMSFILHVVSEANLNKWTIKNILSRDICILTREKQGILKLVTVTTDINKNLSEAEIKWKE